MIIFFSQISHANSKDTIFTIAYAKNSPIKTIPLKSAQLRLLIYYHGIPKGYTHITTDENQQFSYDFYKNAGVDLALELVKIVGENKFNAHCQGTTTIANPRQLLVHCKSAK